jgi:hypothetical protein
MDEAVDLQRCIDRHLGAVPARIDDDREKRVRIAGRS